MRFRSLVVTWCVYAIHSGMQIASGHRSLDASRSTYQPSGDIETFHVHTKNIPRLPSTVLLLPTSRPHFPSRHTVGAISKLTVFDEKPTEHQKLIKSMMADRERSVESFTKHESRKRRKKCSCRKWDSRRRIGLPLVKDKELHRSSVPKCLFTSVGTTNIPMTLNSAPASTTQRFMDMPFTDVIPSRVNATITKTVKIIKKKIHYPIGIYRRSSPHKGCKKIKCMTKNCKKKRKRKMNVINVLERNFIEMI